jgi:hypothetical protein
MTRHADNAKQSNKFYLFDYEFDFIMKMMTTSDAAGPGHDMRADAVERCVDGCFLLLGLSPDIDVIVWRSNRIVIGRGTPKGTS